MGFDGFVESTLRGSQISLMSIRSLNNYMIFTYSYHRVYYELKIGHLSMWLDSSVDRALHWIWRSWVWITIKPEIFSGCFSTAYIVSWEHTARITNFTIYTVWLLCLKSPVKGASIKMYVCMLCMLLLNQFISTDNAKITFNLFIILFVFMAYLNFKKNSMTNFVTHLKLYKSARSKPSLNCLNTGN